MVVNRIRTGLLIACAVVLVPAVVAWGPMEASYQGGFGHWVTLEVVLMATCLVVSAVAARRREARQLSLGLAVGAVVLSPLLIFATFAGWFLFVFHPE